MNIERELRLFADRSHHGRTERDVVHEVAVHDVEVKPVSPRFYGAADFIGETREIGGENGRGDEHGRHWTGAVRVKF
jgi:hypothetical protein